MNYCVSTEDCNACLRERWQARLVAAPAASGPADPHRARAALRRLIERRRRWRRLKQERSALFRAGLYLLVLMQIRQALTRLHGLHDQPAEIGPPS